MKRILLGTTLLLSASFCGHIAHADVTYTASTNIVSPPNGATYTAYYPNPASIPISVTNQFVDVTGAAPSSQISVTWSMYDNVSTASGPLVIAYDRTRTSQLQLTDMYGHFRRNVNNNGSGSLSATATSTGGSYTFGSGSGIAYGSLPAHTYQVQVSFTVDTAI